MRTWSIVLAILVGLATTAHAKRLMCAPPLAAPERIEGTQADLAAPVVHDVTFSSDGVSINAVFPPETARVRLTYTDGGEHVEVWTTPARPFVCIPHVPDAPMLASVFVFDDSGHVNQTLTTATVLPRRPFRCGTGVMAMYFVGIPLALIALSILLLVRAALYRRKLKRPGEAVSPLVAETLTRAFIANTLVVLAAGFTLSTLLYVTGDGVYAALVAWIPISRLVRLKVARRLLRRIERQEPAQLHGNMLAALDDFIVIPRSILRSAAHAGVPSATMVS